MKTFTAALAVLFVAALCYQVSSAPPSVESFGTCCVKFLPRPLPLHLVKSYRHTSCSPPAVIFITIKENLVCANPEDEWVQDMMNHLKGREHHG